MKNCIKNKCCFKFSRGVTLVELLVSMSILAILLTVGVPSFNQFSVNSRLTGYANTMFSNISLARSESLKRSGLVVMCKSTDGANCTNGGDWSQGWIAFADLDNNNVADDGLLLFTMPALAAGYTFVGNNNIANRLTFDTNGARQAGTFTVCPPAPAPNGSGREVVLNLSGRARVATINACP